LFNKEVSILADPKADPEKGTGIVMCCTFGDATDIKWWREHNLLLINIIGTDGRLNTQAEFLAGLDIRSARKKIIEELDTQHLILDAKNTFQTVSVHERCDTPVEYIETKQWFIKIMDQKERLLDAGRKITWHPEFMLSRYENWVRNLEWDWCISRQRYHGVPFPLWYCTKCEGVIMAEISELPVDPRTHSPSKPCECGSQEFTPETSVMDTWMTSSLTPQIAGRWLDSSELFNRVFPMSLRPQAHDIIRTWTFYTIVKSIYHLDKIPWTDIAISGHGLSLEGHKVSKSKSRNLMDPFKVMEKFSADAIRYWAASTKLGEDSMIDEEKIAVGQRLVNKMWNIARFSYPFLSKYDLPESVPPLVPTDKWVLSHLQHLIKEVSDSYNQYDHASAKNKIEAYFWEIIADNYIEMVKNRLYDQVDGTPAKESAKFTLYQIFLTVLKMLAPIIPYVTEEIFQLVFKRREGEISIHLSRWPVLKAGLINSDAEAVGEALVEVATAARRYKSKRQLPMGVPLDLIKITTPSNKLLNELQECITDIRSVTRASSIELGEDPLRQISADIKVPNVIIFKE
jgi:valyl-tRNA synthetase